MRLCVIRGLFEIFAQFAYAEMCFAVGTVILSGCADGDAGHKVFAF